MAAETPKEPPRDNDVPYPEAREWKSPERVYLNDELLEIMSPEDRAFVMKMLGELQEPPEEAPISEDEFKEKEKNNGKDYRNRSRHNQLGDGGDAGR